MTTFEHALDITLARIREDVLARRNEPAFVDMWMASLRKMIAKALKILNANEILRGGYCQLRLSLFQKTHNPLEDQLDIEESINAAISGEKGEIAATAIMMLMQEWKILRYPTKREIEEKTRAKHENAANPVLVPEALGTQELMELTKEKEK